MNITALSSSPYDQRKCSWGAAAGFHLYSAFSTSIAQSAIVFSIINGKFIFVHYNYFPAISLGAVL